MSDVTTAGAHRMLAFVSFDLQDAPTLALFQSELSSCHELLEVANWSLEEPPAGPEWKKVRKDRIYRSDLMVILVGSGTESAANVLEDIQIARGSNIPFFGIFLPGAQGDWQPPAGLARNRVVTWDPKAVAAALGQMMTEGKHHKFK